MKQMLAGCKNLTLPENVVHIKSALNEESAGQLEALAAELCHDYLEQQSETANKIDLTALFKNWIWPVCGNVKRRQEG